MYYGLQPVNALCNVLRTSVRKRLNSYGLKSVIQNNEL